MTSISASLPSRENCREPSPFTGEKLQPIGDDLLKAKAASVRQSSLTASWEPFPLSPPPSSVRSKVSGIRAQTGSSERKPPRESTAVSPASMPRVESQQKRQKRLGPWLSHFSEEAICPSKFTGLEMPRLNLFPGKRKSGWMGPGLDNGWHESAQRQNYAPFTFPVSLLPLPVVAEEMKSPLDTGLCGLLIPEGVRL